MNLWNIPDDIELIDVKKTPIGEDDLDYLRSLVGSYKDLLNKRSQILKKRGVTSATLNEAQTKELILDHYSLLIRPLLVYGDRLFAGNGPDVVSQARAFLNEK